MDRMNKAKRYLAMVSDSMSERGPKNETLAEHRKHCKAEKGECPFEQRADESDAQVEEGARRSSVMQEEDAAYADAVKRGDRETALRMIRQAAARAMPDTKVVDKDGLPRVVYHGTKEVFTQFKYQNTSYGYFFAPDRRTAEYYGNTMPVFLNAKRIADFDDTILFCDIAEKSLSRDTYNQRRDDDEVDYVFEQELDSDSPDVRNFIKDVLLLDDEDTSNFTDDDWYEKLQDARQTTSWDSDIESYPALKRILDEHAPIHDYRSEDPLNAYGSQEYYMKYQSDMLSTTESEGYDGVYMTDPSYTGDSHSYVVFNSSQIKSADVTYDDDLNLIPLSKRFNFDSNDIRY